MEWAIFFSPPGGLKIWSEAVGLLDSRASQKICNSFMPNCCFVKCCWLRWRLSDFSSRWWHGFAKAVK